METEKSNILGGGTMSRSPPGNTEQSSSNEMETIEAAFEDVGLDLHLTSGSDSDASYEQECFNDIPGRCPSSASLARNEEISNQIRSSPSSITSRTQESTFTKGNAFPHPTTTQTGIDDKQEKAIPENKSTDTTSNSNKADASNENFEDINEHAELFKCPASATEITAEIEIALENFSTAPTGERAAIINQLKENVRKLSMLLGGYIAREHEEETENLQRRLHQKTEELNDEKKVGERYRQHDKRLEFSQDIISAELKNMDESFVAKSRLLTAETSRAQALTQISEISSVQQQKLGAYARSLSSQIQTLRTEKEQSDAQVEKAQYADMCLSTLPKEEEEERRSQYINSLIKDKTSLQERLAEEVKIRAEQEKQAAQNNVKSTTKIVELHNELLKLQLEYSRKDCCEDCEKLKVSNKRKTVEINSLKDKIIDMNLEKAARNKDQDTSMGNYPTGSLRTKKPKEEHGHCLTTVAAAGDSNLRKLNSRLTAFSNNQSDNKEVLALDSSDQKSSQHPDQSSTLQNRLDEAGWKIQTLEQSLRDVKEATQKTLDTQRNMWGDWLDEAITRVEKDSQTKRALREEIRQLNDAHCDLLAKYEGAKKILNARLRQKHGNIEDEWDERDLEDYVVRCDEYEMYIKELEQIALLAEKEAARLQEVGEQLEDETDEKVEALELEIAGLVTTASEWYDALHLSREVSANRYKELVELKTRNGVLERERERRYATEEMGKIEMERYEALKREEGLAGELETLKKVFGDLKGEYHKLVQRDVNGE